MSLNHFIFHIKNPLRLEMSKLKPREKRQARILALQLIYAKDFEGSELDETCNLIMESDNSLSEEIIIYGKQLSNLVFLKLKELDHLIANKSRNWDFSRITLLDKLILRISLVEMIYVEEVPPKVSIAEGVEIAKLFSTDDSSSFINGILDSVYNEIIKVKVKSK